MMNEEYDDKTLKMKIDKLTDSFFDKKYVIYKHLHNSYNMLIDNVVNYLQKSENMFDENRIDNMLYRYRFKFSNISVRPPLQEDGIKRLYPHEARDANLTYSLKIIGNIEQIQEVYDLSSRETILTRVVGEVKDEVILIIPCMVRSKYCSLNNNPHYKSKDCEFDPGGYFIVNGSEKIVLCFEKIISNKPIVFYKKDGDQENYKIRISSKPSNPNIMMQSIDILIDRYMNINIKVPILNEVSVFVLMRALGLESDKEIMNCIVYKKEDIEMINLLKLGISNSKQEGKRSILSKEDAVLCLMNKLRVVKKYIIGDKNLQYEEKKEDLYELLRNKFMPHIDTNRHNDVLKTKALFLGYMINKLLNAYLGRKDYAPDDRDSFINKRIDTQGDLIYELIKQGLKRNFNECNKFHKKRTGSNHGTPINIISKLKPSNIEQAIKSAMMTGNWGKKKGAAQMYQRLTFLQALSFLRRVDASSGSSSSTMKLTGPRHYNASQVGFLCLTGDSEVLMADGSVKLIKDVRDGDSVVTLDTETMQELTTPIKNWFKKDCDKLLKVTTVSGRELKCTPEHKLLTKVGDKFEMVETEKLTTDNYLVIRHSPKYIPLDKETEVIIKKEDVIEQYRLDLMELGYLDRPVSQKKLEMLARLIGLNITDGHLGKHKTKDYYSCEFCVGEIKDAYDLLDDIMYLGFGTPYVARTETKHTDKNNGKVTIYKTIKVSKNGPFAYLLKHLGAFVGKKIEMKRTVPEWIMNANNRIKREFISGFIAGDGCRLSTNKNGDTFKIHCGATSQTCSKEMIKETKLYMGQISELLNYFEINNNITSKKSNYDENKFHFEIHFEETYENLNKYSDIINFRYCNEKRRKSALTVEYIKHKNTHSRKMDKLYEDIIKLHKENKKPKEIHEILKCKKSVIDRILQNYRKGKIPKARQLGTEDSLSYEKFTEGTLINNDLLLVKIKSIEKTETEQVYDFETKYYTHNFITKGIASSNCAIESPEHSNIGLIKNLVMMSTIIISPTSEVDNVYELLVENKNFIHMNNLQPAKLGILTKIFLDGEWVGFTENPVQFRDELLKMKRNNIMLSTNGITLDPIFNEIRISTDSGRLSRPLLRVENNKLVVTPKMIDDIMDNKEYQGKNRWEIFMSHYPDAIENVDMEEQYYHLVATKPEKISDMRRKNKIVYPDNDEPIINRYDEALIERYSHCEFDPAMIMGIIAANIPFSNHNFGSRNMYQYAQGKQAMSLYASNYKVRFDITYILYNVQRPLVNTKASKYIHTDILPCGENCYVMIGCYSGYNQDDSIIVNQTAIDRGLFRSISLKKWDSKIERNQSTSQVDVFRKPEPETLVGSRHANYDKLNDKGFTDEETEIENGDVIIGKVTPIQPIPGSNKHFKDSSTIYKSHEKAIIDKVIYGIQNAEGYDMIKIRTRSERVPKIGDKYCCTTSDHEVLTESGWKFINEITLEDKVATLQNGNTLEYHNPTAVQEYDCNEELYKIKSNQIDLVVTKNHRMYVGPERGNGEYKILQAHEIYGKKRRYKKNVENYKVEKDITHINFKAKKKEDRLCLEIDPWLTFFGIWIAEGCTLRTWGVSFATHKQRVKDALEECCRQMNLEIRKHKDKINDDQRNAWCINNKRLVRYFKKLSVGAINKSLPKWVWRLNKEQCRKLIAGMMLGDGHTMENGTERYDTSSTQLADDFQKLCLHAGWSCNKMIKYKAGHESVKKDGYVIKSNVDAYRLTIIKSQNNPLVNKNITKTGENRHDSYVTFDDEDLQNCIKNKVFCCTVPGDGIMYMRRNGVVCWCGNSRHGQKGVIGLTMSESDLPFTKDGIVPDIIINPNAIPSRMTVAHLMETLYGKVACFKGIESDATAFQKCDLKDVGDSLEGFGYNRDGTEIMYSGITGEEILHDFFIGPIYYQRLRHLVSDKMHCLSCNISEVLTENGWKKHNELVLEDKVATLVDNRVVYEKPKNIFHYPYFNGKMYHVSNDNIDLDVTMNHRMWVSKEKSNNEWSKYDFEYAENIIGKRRKYKQTCLNNNKANEEYNKEYNDSDILEKDGIRLLPDWVFSLSQKQSQIFINRLEIIEREYDGDILKSCSYLSCHKTLIDQLQQLCLHAGYTGIISKPNDNENIWKINIILVEEEQSLVINYDNSINDFSYEYIYDYKGGVFCVEVESGVFMVRQNGKPCWTGNSRARGPVTTLTRQAPEGRSKDGGLKCGEMERDTIISYGMSKFLKERFVDIADKYSCYVCDICGLFAQRVIRVENSSKPQKSDSYICMGCNNDTKITKIIIPYAFKLLIQELMSINIAPRIRTKKYEF